MLKKFLKNFQIMTTSVLIGAAVCISIFEHIEQIKYNLGSIVIWQMLILSFIMAGLITVILQWEPKTRRDTLAQNVLMYISVSGGLIIGGISFGWVNIREPKVIISFLIVILILYTAVSILDYKGTDKMAKKLNEKLEMYNKER